MGTEVNMPRKARVEPVMRFTFNQIVAVINNYLSGSTNLEEFIKKFLPMEWDSTYVKNDFTSDQKSLIFDIRRVVREKFPSYNKDEFKYAEQTFKSMIKRRMDEYARATLVS